jgi:16S rRNA (uracil1498-N3)-methyltransferase
MADGRWRMTDSTLKIAINFCHRSSAIDRRRTAIGHPPSVILNTLQFVTCLMALPFFYLPEYSPGMDQLELDEETSRHIIQVLRMKKGESLQLTNGKGDLLNARILQEHKKKTLVKINNAKTITARASKISIAISLVKNSSRLEWFLEKATEIGITEIIPMLCTRTEKNHFRFDRMQTILISAMLQSQQSWLPVLHEPVSFSNVIRNFSATRQFIAHCMEENKQKLKDLTGTNKASQLILIGPEGDFTQEEIHEAFAQQFVPVSLGDTRLRTETAGLVAATLLKNAG